MPIMWQTATAAGTNCKSDNFMKQPLNNFKTSTVRSNHNPICTPAAGALMKYLLGSQLYTTDTYRSRKYPDSGDTFTAEGYVTELLPSHKTHLMFVMMKKLPKTQMEMRGIPPRPHTHKTTWRIFCQSTDHIYNLFII